MFDQGLHCLPRIQLHQQVFTYCIIVQNTVNRLHKLSLYFHLFHVLCFLPSFQNLLIYLHFTTSGVKCSEVAKKCFSILILV